MKTKFAVVAVLATALAVAPFSPAQAGWHGGYRGDGFVFGAVGAVVGAAAALVAAPFILAGDIVAPVAPAPVYYAPPAPVAYNYAPGYYAPEYYAPRQYVAYRYAPGYGYRYGYR